MKLLHILISTLLVLLILTGCTSRTQAEPIPATTTPTEALTTEATEPPTEAPTERALTAFEIFYKAKAAAPEAATQFTTNEEISLRTSANGITLDIEYDIQKQTALSSDPFAINICSKYFGTMTGMEIEQTIREYFRKEGEDIVYYVDIEQIDWSLREVLPQQLYPEIDTEEFPDVDILSNEEWLLATSSVQGYPPENYAQYMDLEPETQIIDGREVYVLRYRYSALWLFGATGNASVDANLGAIQIPTYWYVDAETFMPIKKEFTLQDLDPLVTAAMVDFLNIQLPEDVTDLELEITEYTYTLTDMVFDPVDIPEIPEDIINRAKEADSYAAM